MGNEFLITTLNFLGKILLATMALMVHKKVSSEKKIDKKVLTKMKLETSFGILSIILFIMSYILSII